MADYIQPRIGQNEIGRLSSRIGRIADSNADIRLFQSRSVVDSIARHANDVALSLQCLDNLKFMLGIYFGKTVGFFYELFS